MSGGYGPPLLDFSPLAGLADTFFNARDRALKRKQDEEAPALIEAYLSSISGQTSDAPSRGTSLSKFGQGSQAFTTSTGTPPRNIERGTVHIAEDEDDVQRLERATGMNVEPDLDKVVRTVYGEAAGEGIIGQKAVASVIANRARQSGMTPTDVVLAKGQFEPWSDPAARARMEGLDANSPEYRRLSDLVRPVLAGQSADPTGGATHFYAPKAQAALGRDAPSWDDGTGRDIGNHRFFAHGYGPQGKVQVAQADAPAPGAKEAQFQIPGQVGMPAAQAGAQPVNRQMLRALYANPNTRPLVAEILKNSMNPQSQFDFQVVGDQLYRVSKRTGEVEAVPGVTKKSEAPTTRQIKQDDGSEVVVQWDAEARQWIPMPAPAGGTAVKGPPKLTETQSKDVGFYNRGSKIIDRLDKQDEALTDALSKVGGNVSNYLKTPQYRQAEQTAREFLAVLLRKDTGAAVTPQEMEMYSSIFLPQPADDPTTIAQKKAARRSALEGIRMGLGTAEIIFSSQEALQKQPAPTTPTPPAQSPTPQTTAPVEGARKAPDGNWYVPDPNRPGKYLQVQ